MTGDLVFDIGMVLILLFTVPVGIPWLWLLWTTRKEW